MHFLESKLVLFKKLLLNLYRKNELLQHLLLKLNILTADYYETDNTGLEIRSYNT